MSNKIYPIIFFSISEDGKEMIEAIKKYSFKINQPVYSKFVRFINFNNKENSITTSINDDKLLLPFNHKKNDKLSNYAGVNKNRQKYLSVFEALISDINNIENINYALDNNFEVERTQVIILSSIYNPNLSPLILPLILGIDVLDGKINFQFILLYNKTLTREKSKDSRILKNSFLREIETLKLIIKPKVWLFDIINEEGINLKEKKNLYYVVSQFINLLISDADRINQATYGDGNKTNKKPCMYSSIGYSLLKFPIERIKEYMTFFAYSEELHNLSKKFDLKFESIQLKDELTKFLKENGFENIPEKISKKENSDPIHVPFTFINNVTQQEKEEVLLKELKVIESPSTLSKTTTIEFFQKIDDFEQKYVDNVQINFSGDLNSSKNREFSKHLLLIKEMQYDFIDNKAKGINYSLLFVAILSNNKAIVESMLNGRFTSRIPSLISLEDKYRSVFIGDEVSLIEKQIREESTNSSNKLELIEKYTVKLEDEEISFVEIDTAVNHDNPKLAELKASIENYKNEISELEVEVENHNKKIKKLKSKIEKIKSDFDRDATKEKYKTIRNTDLLKEIEHIRTNDVDVVDRELSEKYEEKNIKIKERKKFILKNLIIVPLILLFILLLPQVILFNIFDWFDVEILIKGIFVIIIFELVYYAYSFIKFHLLKKQFKILIGELNDLFQRKKNIFQKYISKKNQCFENDFSFERDLIAFSMMGDLIDAVSKLQKNVEQFKIQISEESNKNLILKNSFVFVNSNFEICVVEKDNIEEIYKNNINSKLFHNSSDDNSLSMCYKNFISTNELILLNQIIDKKVDDVFSRKVQIENLKSLLFNESISFSKLNTKAKFDILIDTSRPLLKTSKSLFPNISADIPYTENIIIGYKDNVYDSYLDKYDLKYSSSIKINEKNDNELGILSIKSNFPSFIIYDVESNENLTRKEVNINNKVDYFISDIAFNYQLMPTLTNVEKDGKGDILMGSGLIVALTKRIINFNAENSVYSHPIVGELGFKLEDLIDYWNKPICYDIKEKTKIIDNEIWLFDKDEMADYLIEFIEFWSQFKGVLSKKYEIELSEYFLLRKGKESDWNDIKSILKKNRKNRTK